MIITKDEITNLLLELARVENTFLCEAQFQFELAWKLREYFVKCKKTNIQIYLEYPSYDKGKNRNRQYFDIVIVDNTLCCVIELKYKTKAQPIIFNGLNIYLKNHAAQDIGRFDFLKDVSRIENFKKNNREIFDCGYSILLTNDKVYWEKDGNNCIYKEFSLKDKTKIVSGDKKWEEGTNEKAVGKLRKSGLKLDNVYDINWIDFNEKFRFLIFQI